MWPRAIFDRFDTSGNRKKALVKAFEVLGKPGIYVLYRDDVPYYVGQATRLHSRLRRHALRPDGRYYNFWNFFSAFVIEDPKSRNAIEGILIAAMPTANGAKPRLSKEKMPKKVKDILQEIRRSQANPERTRHS
jgi:hypothetical protein